MGPFKRESEGYSGQTVGHWRALLIVVSLFFTWGFLTCLNDVLNPHLRAIFVLSYRSATLVQSVFFATAVVCAWPSGRLIERVGYKRTITIALVIMGAGAALFIPVASFGRFPPFLLAVVALAAGITALQTAAGPYLTKLGPEASAPSRFSLALGLNSLGTMLAPLFGSRFILSRLQMVGQGRSPNHAAAVFEQAAALKLPYAGIAAGLLLLAIVVAVAPLPTVSVSASVGHASIAGAGHPWKLLLREPQLVFGAVAMFFYVGAEVSIGSALVSYLNLPTVGAFSLPAAAQMTSLYWGSAMLGRLVGAVVLRRIQAMRALTCVAICALCLVLLSVASTGTVAAGSMLLVGLFNSIMVPIIFTHSIEGLGTLTPKGSSVMVAMMVGGALLPFAQAFLADNIGLRWALLLPAMSYAVITLYAVLQQSGRDRIAELPDASSSSR